MRDYLMEATATVASDCQARSSDNLNRSTLSARRAPLTPAGVLAFVLLTKATKRQEIAFQRFQCHQHTQRFSDAKETRPEQRTTLYHMISMRMHQEE